MTQVKDPIELAQEIAYEAQDALEHGRMDVHRRVLSKALGVDPLCCHALLMRTALLDTPEARIPLLRDALEGSLRAASSGWLAGNGHGSFVQGLREATSDLRPQVDGRRRRSVRSDPNGGRSADRWHDISMRDHVRVLHVLGENLVRSGRCVEAALHLRECLSLSPPDRYGTAAWLCAALLDQRLVDEARALADVYEFEGLAWTKAVGILCDAVRSNDVDDMVGSLEALRDIDAGFIVAIEDLVAGRNDAISGDEGSDGAVQALAYGVRRHPLLVQAIAVRAKSIRV